ncbi:DUF5916 domain-containing protein [Gelatiniphilus marinus]|uniref:DUF5916 domain-containing protein n=1 Tax=Gelatiniphilus marinus TaxID=1759464 RepID=A0ABW5JNK6_9FLAO
MRQQTTLCSILLCFFLTQAQDKKTLHVLRTEKAPKIDGVLNDKAWKNADEAKGFTQFRPEMGIAEKAHQKTTVKITFDDNAIYVGAYLKDKPEDIQKQFTSRDNFGQSDFFGVVLNPNNDAQNDTEFFVFSSGTQADAIASPSIDGGEDFGWNAVWDSAVKIVDDGWIVEMKIPYRALRFSNDDVQTWGIQFHRRYRIDNSQYSWNPIDRTKGNIGLYHGELTGIKNIEPPTRLSLYPFVSGISTYFDGEHETDLKMGLDVKYGITENFTLDATLIPDFSQAAFDNVRLNLGPFEQTFSEQRQFFKEGVDLFNKGNLFFSRRVGNSPVEQDNIEDELISNNNINEEIIDNPNIVKTLNAVKVSGRTKKGLGLGFFNAITQKTRAKIKTTKYIRDQNTQAITDSIITYRNKVTEPLANYNILVLDQQFNKNSSVSFINTNVTRDGNFRDANATGLLADVSNKRNTYNIRGEVKMSNVNLSTGISSGLSSFFRAGKTHGKLRYSIDHEFADEKYDINDLGLNLRNNFNNFGFDALYQIFEPTKRLNAFRANTWANYRRLYKPSTFTGTNFGMRVSAQNKKLMWFGARINIQPGKQYDYFEPRDFENKRFFIYKNFGSTGVWLETNPNKTFSIETNLNLFTLFDSTRDLFGYELELEPTIRFNDKLKITYEFEYQNNKGSRGFVDNINDDIVFGERDVVSVENGLYVSYNFNPLHAINFNFRNFWSTVNYDYQLFILENNGTVSANNGYNVDSIEDSPNINFNTWNLDLRYSWQFAPGSQLTALYRNSLFNSDNASKDSYFNSLNTLFNQPIQHVFSLRLQYFIDYSNLKTLFKK